MRHDFVPGHLDVRGFGHGAGQLAGLDAVARYGRIAQECQEQGLGRLVEWSARGELRMDALGQEQIWLHLRVDTTVPLTCQRCLGAVDVRLAVERSFRFVADEQTAAQQDDAAAEDLLALNTDFDLQQLVEDELVLALPLIARHEVCPAPPPLVAQDAGAPAPTDAAPNPFAVLAQLKPGPGGRRR